MASLADSYSPVLGSEGNCIWRKSVEFLSKSPGEILDILKCGAAGTRGARDRPFERFGADLLGRRLEFVMVDIGEDHVEIIVLAAFVKAEPEAEAVGKRDFSSTASPGLIALERSLSIMSRGSRWRRLEVA